MFTNFPKSAPRVVVSSVVGGLTKSTQAYKFVGNLFQY